MREVVRVLREINAAGVAILLVEQMPDVALELASRSYILGRGVLRAAMPSDEIRRDEALQQRFLGVS